MGARITWAGGMRPERFARPPAAAADAGASSQPASPVGRDGAGSPYPRALPRTAASARPTSFRRQRSRLEGSVPEQRPQGGSEAAEPADVQRKWSGVEGTSASLHVEGSSPPSFFFASLSPLSFQRALSGTLRGRGPFFHPGGGRLQVGTRVRLEAAGERAPPLQTASAPATPP